MVLFYWSFSIGPFLLVHEDLLTVLCARPRVPTPGSEKHLQREETHLFESSRPVREVQSPLLAAHVWVQYFAQRWKPLFDLAVDEKRQSGRENRPEGPLYLDVGCYTVRHAIRYILARSCLSPRSSTPPAKPTT